MQVYEDGVGRPRPSAANRAAGFQVEDGAPGFGSKAYFNVGRYQRDVAKGSTLGLFLTDRRFGDRQPRSGWNRLRRTLFLKLSYGYRR
jgi:hypothetical protein